MLRTPDPMRTVRRGSRSKPTGKDNPKPSIAKISHVFVNLIWPRRMILLFGLLLIGINRLSGLVLPYSPKLLIDEVIEAGTLSLWVLVLAVAAASIIQAVSSFFLTKVLSVEAHELIAELRTRIHDHVIYLPVGYFDNTKTGIMVSRIMNDIEGVRNLVGTGLVQLLGGLLQAVVAFVLLLNISTPLTLIALVPLTIFGLISMKAFAYIRPIFRKRSAIIGDVTGRLTEALAGIRVIKGFHAEEREREVFRKGAFRIFDNVRKTLTTTSLVTSSSVMLLGLSSSIIMFYGGAQMMDDAISVGDFFAFTLTLGFMITPVVQMTNIGTQLTEAFAGLDRMEEILAESREQDNQDRTVELSEVRGHYIFDDVWFAYEEDQDVIKGVSFEAPPGTVTALVGSSGSGKTTIASLAASFLTPNRGTIYIDQADLSGVRLDTFRKHLGVVLQEDFLFDGTIRENILFAKPDADEDQLREVVEAAHVDEFIDRFDDGLETLIGERGVKLSGGQKQRITIARALLANPRILILDEATSNLDAESERFIQSSLQTLMQGRTTFVIAHRLSTIRRADQILVLEDGQVVERGTHEQLLEKQGRYYELYTFQSRI